MKPSSCHGFRNALERALRGAPGDGGARELAWHEHLLWCGECQELLRSEEALEELFGSLPVPSLPPDLARRVLLRLERERRSGDDLDQLLETSPLPATPAGLGARVLLGLQASRLDERLDALLERVPAPRAPRGLAGRVLAELEAERSLPGRSKSGRPVFTFLRGGGRRAAAAAVLLALGAGLAWQLTRARAPVPVEDDLLSQLEVLENWDALMSDDLDLYLASLDPVDWTLLELEAEELQAEEDEG